MPDETTVMLEPITFSDFQGMMLDHARPITDTLPTPLPTWNAACRGEGGGLGLAPGWLVIAAGKPGAGKSALALNAARASMQAKRRVMYHSLEMSRAQLLTRFVSVATGCDLRRIERGAHYDSATFLEALTTMDAAGVFGRLLLCDRPPRTTGGLT